MNQEFEEPCIPLQVEDVNIDSSEEGQVRFPTNSLSPASPDMITNFENA